MYLDDISSTVVTHWERVGRTMHKNSAWYTPAQFFIPKHGTAYHDEIFLKITRAWYNSLAWYTLCAENLIV